MSILIFVVILLVLVLVHEFGHFFVAKRLGMRVDEFGFGFPPKLFGKKYGETEYTVNLLPIGGFVKIFGENPDGESMAGPDSARSFVNKPRSTQALVLLAGICMNLVLAWLLFSLGFMSGLPTSVNGIFPADELRDVHLVILSVAKDSPAEKAGLLPGDKIFSVSEISDTTAHYIDNPTPAELKNFILSRGGSSSTENLGIGITYGRAGTNTEKRAIMEPEITEGVPSIGISMDEIGIAKLSFFRALGRGFQYTLAVLRGTVFGLYHLIVDSVRGQGSLASVTGPVGLVGIVGDAYRFGFAYLLSFAGLVSVNLAVINLVPFPALDGGRLLFILIEKIKGSPIRPKAANLANSVGFAFLILLMLVVTYHDVVKLF